MSDTVLSTPPTFLGRCIFAAMGCSVPFAGSLDENTGIIRILTLNSSAYLVPTSSTRIKYLLIDTGMDAKAVAIKNALIKVGVAPSDVEAVFITHGHIDHTSGVRWFPKAAIYMAKPDQGFVTGKTKSEGFLGTLVGKKPAIAIEDVSMLKSVANGDQITIGEKIIHCFSVPGHTQGSMAYAIDDLLFIGDSLVCNRAGRVKNVPLFLTPRRDENLQSLKRLVVSLDDMTIPIQTVVPSHSATGTFDALRKFVQ